MLRTSAHMALAPADKTLLPSGQQHSVGFHLTQQQR
jgi:hypothetical protein